MKIKKDLYGESGAREYWIVDPAHESVSRYNLTEDGIFGPYNFVSNDAMPSIIFPDFTLSLSEIFPAKVETPAPDNEERL